MKKLLVILLCLGLCGCATARMTYLKPAELSPYGKFPVRANYVMRGSEAEKAGLKAGDIIEEIDGKKSTSNGDVYHDLLETQEEGIAKINRNGETLTLRLKKDNNKDTPCGIFLWQEEWTPPYVKPKGVYQYLLSKNGIIIAVTGVETETSPLIAIYLEVKNRRDDDIDIFPENILILDGQNSILKLFGGKILAANMAENAEGNYNAYRDFASTQLAAAQAQPPSSYTVTGFTQHTGSGTLYSYGSYGNFNYSGRSFSNYQITAQPNYGAGVASLGYAVGMMIAKNRAENQMKAAESLNMNTFEFGQIPSETNRVGFLFCQKPLYYPLQIKVGLKGNTFLFKLEKPENK